MPIRLPDSLPATRVLEQENVFVMTEHRAISQDIRPLRILLANLMPNKVETETQILRKLSNTPLQVEVDLLRMSAHESTHVAPGHLERFYRTFEEVRSKRYDGMIVTGAPVETLPFEQVDYWGELTAVLDWSRASVFSTFYICWGAQAGLYHHFGIGKRELPQKLSGVFEHRIAKPTSPLVRGLDDVVRAPHSRHTESDRRAILAHPSLEPVIDSEEAGLLVAKSVDSRHFFVFGHLEYDHDTLAREYERDRQAGLDPQLPLHYFPKDDPSQPPASTWRSAAQLVFGNWLNYYVYQATPYDLAALPGAAPVG